MKILVTGGAGYIGSHAVYSLIEQGYDVVIIDNLSKGFKSNIHPKAMFYNADIRNESELQEIFKIEKNIEGIMNFAGLIIVPESVIEPLKYFNNNTHGVEVLLKVATNFNVKYFIFSSTAAVYGEPKNVPILETDLKEPINPYGESKLAAEAIIRGWANATSSNYVIFRYFNVAGAHKSGKIGIKGNSLTHLLPCVIESAINNKTFKVMGTNYETKDGSCIRDFVHVVDLVEAHIIGLEWSIKNKKSDIFNLGSGNGYSVLEVLNESIATLKINIPNELSSRRDGDPAKLFADTKKVRSILKWETKYSLEQMIQTEYDFRKNNENE
ncbi:MAG: UDP-glucose 4-epimerase GalE [Mycoplasmataceae bacterium]|nr:UDP-glucose 4-epimerase GalE [Mycoplasmataceae bacterium]